MILTHQTLCTAFAAQRLIASGPLADVALKTKAAMDAVGAEPALIFNDETGDLIELDLRGDEAAVVARLSTAEPDASDNRRVGRPKLGVVSREVTLLPRHWDWLAIQPEGASAALRKLVEEARRDVSGKDRARRSLRAADRFMYRMGGDLPLFEDAYRAFYAKDFDRMSATTCAVW